MIGIIISIIAVIIFFTIIRKDKNSRPPNYKPWGLVGDALIIFCCATVIFFTTDGIVAATQRPTETTTTELVASQEIVALKDNSNVSGQFFLGSGSVNQEEYYVYYTVTEHGYKKEKLSADSTLHPVYIKYISDNETPHIDLYSTVTRKTLTKAPNSWLSLIHYFEYKNYKVGDVVEETVNSPNVLQASGDNNYYDNFRIEIYIPEGSIQENYVIDLE